MFIDKVQNTVRGHLTVEMINENGDIVDKFETPNLIVSTARTNMAEVIGGVASGYPINKIVIGTQGHNGDILVPKTVNEGFDISRTELFSEETSDFFYPVEFTVDGTAYSVATITNEIDSGSSMIREYADNAITYTYLMPQNAGNDTGTVIYTEAGLYAGPNLFSMKTFKGKIKDNTVSLRIIWKITF